MKHFAMWPMRELIPQVGGWVETQAQKLALTVERGYMVTGQKSFCQRSVQVQLHSLNANVVRFSGC